MKQRRVVVTGLGVISPLGCTVSNFWQNLVNSSLFVLHHFSFEICNLLLESGTKSYPTQFKNETEEKLWKQIPSKVAAPVDKDEFKEQMKWCLEQKKFPDVTFSENRMTSFIQYANVATYQALIDAQWFPQNEQQQEDTGVIIGSGIGKVNELTENYQNLLDGVCFQILF